jgi:hypothetical protein
MCWGRGEAYRQARLKHRRWRQGRDEQRGTEQRATRRAVAATGYMTVTSAYDYASYERLEHLARTWASASHRAFTLQATGLAMANATLHMFMKRENSRFEMMQAGVNAVASVEMAVPPTMGAGELSATISEGETSGGDFSDGNFTDIDD